MQHVHTLPLCIGRIYGFNRRISSPSHVFPARFLLLLARFLSDHSLNAVGVSQGDEEIDRRYEADISYGLLDARGKNLTHRACQWVRIAHMVSGDGHWHGRLPGWFKQVLLWSHACIQAGVELKYFSSYLIKQNVLNLRV